MRQDQLELLLQAGAVARIVIFGTPEGWEVWAYGEDGAEVAPGVGNRIKTTRGAVRTFSALDSAYRWLLSVGAVAPRVTVTIEGKTEGGRDAA